MDDANGEYATEQLKQRFCKLWEEHLGGKAIEDGSETWDRLARQYSDPVRHYHTLDHLAHCLRRLDDANSLLGDPGAVELALWFHDMVFEPGDPDNEDHSADLFTQLAGPRMAADFVKLVSELIRDTSHRCHPEEDDSRYLCDIDLSSLGLPWDEFLEDSLAVRAERPDLSDSAFFEAQGRFLTGLLQRPNIFFTEFFQTRYEEKARENIQRYLDWAEKNVPR